MARLTIVSGGQTGVDRAALDAALELGFPCAGWCPAGRLAEDGPIAEIYPLVETASDDNVVRTAANVRDSDATLLIVPEADADRLHIASAGTHLAARTAEDLGRPVHRVRLSENHPDDGMAEEIADWIGRYGIATLNIAGPRESECPGIYREARVLIRKVLLALEG